MRRDEHLGITCDSRWFKTAKDTLFSKDVVLDNDSSVFQFW